MATAGGGTPAVVVPGGRGRGPSKSELTRARVLEAAAVVLNRAGYAGTRLSDIAEIAGLRAAAIYYHFPSRDDLITEVVQVGLRRTMAHVRHSLDALPTGTGAMDRIAAAVRAHLEVVLRDSEFAAAAIRNSVQLPPAIRDVQLIDQNRYGALWRGLLDDGVAAGEVSVDLDPRAARMLVIGAFNWAPEWWHAERGSLEDTVRTAQHLVRRGLAPTPVFESWFNRCTVAR